MYLIYLLISKKIPVHESLKKNIDWVLKDKLAFFVKKILHLLFTFPLHNFPKFLKLYKIMSVKYYCQITSKLSVLN